MEKAYQNVAYLFLAILLIVIIGFYRTYFGLMPGFQDVTSIVHFHAITLMLWSVMLITQPFLIRSKKFATHRTVGKFSYVLAPLIVYSTLALARSKFLEAQPTSPLEDNLARLFLPFSHMFLFVVFYVLAMVNRKNSAKHMRFVLAASFVVLAPAIARINFSWTGLEFNTLILSYVFTDVLIVGLIFFDLSNKRNFRPYALALVLFVIVHFSTFHATRTSFWQSLSGMVAQLFF